MAFTAPPSFTTRPTLRGSFGMSASTHWLATASAQSVLDAEATPSTPPWPEPSCCIWWSRTSTAPAGT